MSTRKPYFHSLSSAVLLAIVYYILVSVPPSTVGQSPPKVTTLPNLSGDDEEELPFDRKAPPKRTDRADPLITPGANAPAVQVQPQSPDVHDILYMKSSKGSSRPIPVRLVSEYMQTPLPNTLAEKLFVFDRISDSGGVKLTIKGREVAGFRYYERRMGEKAARIMNLTSFEDLHNQASRIALDIDTQAYQQAENILVSALTQHDSFVRRGVRVGPNWQTQIRQPLADAIFSVRLSRIDNHLRSRQYAEAWAGCDQLASSSDREGPHWDALCVRFEKVFHARSEAAIGRGDYRAARRLLEERANRVGNDVSETASRVKERLLAEASKLVHQAESKQADSPKEAFALISTAADIWPSLPGLEPLRRKLSGSHAVLHVAYRELPERFSILRPRTIPERHVVSLVHQPLVAWNERPYSGGRFECRLAEGIPQLMERGRAFHLSTRYWNDPLGGYIPCTVEDVRWTMKLLTDPNRLGYSPVTARLFAGVENGPGGDPRKLVIRLQRDFWQPLALMDFPILRCLDASDPAQSSIETPGLETLSSGTGPYRYLHDDSSDTVRLVANNDRSTNVSPRISEIVFHRMEPSAAVDGILAGEIDLIHDVSCEQVARLRKQGVSVECYSVPSVWILAPNYRKALLRNRNLRVALAYSIDRESIVQECFRTTDTSREHSVLMGPYPADSWACPEKVSARVGTNGSALDTRRRQAIVSAESARRELHREEFSLSLVYPAGNESVQRACQQIKRDAASSGIELKPVGIPLNEFYHRVLDQHQFDLVYWRHDFEKPDYCLEPLLDNDPRAHRAGGPNFLGYTQDDTLAGLFAELKRHKHFPTLRRLKHEVHQYVAQNAIVIPLWQLDTYVAVTGRLHPRNRDGQPFKLDASDLFHDIEYWELDPKK